MNSTIRRLCVAALLACDLLTACGLSAVPARAEEDKFKVTNAEKAACTYDAMRFCSDTYPDEMKLLSCMKANRASLSTVCRVAFDAGIKRRHL